MASLISLLIILILSVLITKIAAEALMHTGLSRESAKFQARSAFTGVGYTTDEAESIVNHPVRRKIVMLLMLVGNVGIISVVASLILTFVKNKPDTVESLLRIGIILASLVVLWFLSKSQWLENKLINTINKALEKYTNIKVKDYVELLKLQGDFEITVLTIKAGHWMENKTVAKMQLRDEGINLIGINRENGKYIGAPHGKTQIKANDRLILYGKENLLKELEQRKDDLQGIAEHIKAKRERDKEKQEQEKVDNK